MNRRTWKWRLRYRLGGMLNRVVWRLCDPHDSWMIDYRDKEGRAFGVVSTGFYHLARARARELGGKIVGCKVTTIPADGDGDGWRAPEWKPGDGGLT